MDPGAIRDIVLDTIRSVAPDIDARQVRSERPLREAIELDSTDWLNVFAGLEERLSVEIPPCDHGRFLTVESIVDFVRRLSSLSRYQRFMVMLKELPPAKLAELTHVDQDHHVALVAESMLQGKPAHAAFAHAQITSPWSSRL
jgi:acyl carrier protein